MGFIRSRIIDFCAMMAAVLTATALHGFPWNLDVGLCVAYTVEVLGLALTDKRASVFSADPSRPIAKILLLHVGFLAAVVVIARAGLFLMPMKFVSDPHQSKPINWGLLVVIIALFALAYWEERLLFRKPKRNASATQASADGFEPMTAPGASLFTPAVATAAATPAPSSAAAETVVEESPAPPPLSEAPPEEGFIAGGNYSKSESDEHDEFIQYMHGKNRIFRKPGVSVKQEYELWRAHRAAALNRSAQKKPGLLGRFR
ncbi:MAG: hypothetical protein ABR923_20735 [Terracidiphilus sp.]